MKTFIKSFGALAVAAIALLACEKQEINAPSVSTKLVNFEAKSIETKTVFGEPDGTTYPTLWSANDTKVEVSLNLSSDKGYTSAVEVTPSADYKTATFSATFPETAAAPYVFYALSPSSAYLSNSKENKSWGITIPTTQKPTLTSVDEAAQILAAVSEEYQDLPDLSTIDFHFTHVTAYAKMTLKNAALGDANVNSVSITFGKNVAARWNYSTADGTMSENSAANTITIETSSLTDIWFALAPVDMSGQTVKVVVNTDKGTLTKEITMPEGKKFQSGKIAKFAINMEGAELVNSKVYRLVTDVKELTPGSIVLIAGAETEKAISTTQNKNNRADAGISKGKGVVLDPADDIEIFTVENGTVSGSVAFKATKTSGYIGAPGGGNYLHTLSTKDDNTSFTVTIASDGSAVAVANTTAEQKYLRHNASSTMFSCYKESSSISELVAFYKLEGSEVELPMTMSADPTSFEMGAEGGEESSYLTFSNVPEGVTPEVTAKSSADWITVDYADDVEVDFTVAENTGALREGTITVSCEGVDDIVLTVSQSGAVSMSVADVIDAAKGDAIDLKNVYVGAVSTRGFVVTDGKNNILIYQNATPTVKIGDLVNVTGTKDIYYNFPQVSSPSVTVVSSGNTVPYPAIKDITSIFDTYAATEAEYVTYTATMFKSGKYTNFDVEGAEKNGGLSNAPDSMYEGYAEGDKVKIVGFYNNLNTSTGLQNVIAVSVTKID